MEGLQELDIMTDYSTWFFESLMKPFTEWGRRDIVKVGVHSDGSSGSEWPTSANLPSGFPLRMYDFDGSGF